jgi:hypothetical protein
MTRVKDKAPPPDKRVLTYSPQYAGAVKDPERGMAIAKWNPDQECWLFDGGKSAFAFTPTHWAELPKVGLEVAAEGVADLWPGGGKAWSR